MRKNEDPPITNNRLNIAINGNSNKILKIRWSKQESTVTEIRSNERKQQTTKPTTTANLELWFCCTLISNGKLNTDGRLLSKFVSF